MPLKPAGYYLPSTTMRSRGVRPGVPGPLSGGVPALGRQERPNNPALTALAGPGRNPAGPNARIGGAQAQGGTSPYTPTTELTQDQTANYDEWFSNNDANAQKIQDIGNRNIAAMSRKNATLAALSGSGGGAAYLQGQRAALSSGLATMDNALLANSQARDTIYGNKSASLGALATGAQGYGNQMGLQTQQQDFSAGREDEKAKQEALVGGIQSQGATADAKFNAMLEKGWTPTSDAANAYNALKQARDQAIGEGNITQAQAIQDQINNFNYGAYTADGHAK